MRGFGDIKFAFVTAVKYGNTKAARELLNNIDDEIPDDALFIAVERGHLEMVRLLLGDWRVGLNNNHLYIAVKQNNLEVVRILLDDCRINPSADNNRAYRDAVCLNYKKLTRLLRGYIRNNAVELVIKLRN